ncbi:transposase [Roseomonas sp. WA12]
MSTAPTLRAVFRPASRQTKGLIGSIIALLRLNLAVPDRITLSWRGDTLEMPYPQPGTRPIHLLVDTSHGSARTPARWGNCWTTQRPAGKRWAPRSGRT